MKNSNLINYVIFYKGVEEYQSEQKIVHFSITFKQYLLKYNIMILKL